MCLESAIHAPRFLKRAAEMSLLPYVLRHALQPVQLPRILAQVDVQIRNALLRVSMLVSDFRFNVFIGGLQCPTALLLLAGMAAGLHIWAPNWCGQQKSGSARVGPGDRCSS